MFDIAEAKSKLVAMKNDLLAEYDANAKLQRRFDLINVQLRSKPASGPTHSDDRTAVKSAVFGSTISMEDDDLEDVWPDADQDKQVCIINSLYKLSLSN